MAEDGPDRTRWAVYHALREKGWQPAPGQGPAALSKGACFWCSWRNGEGGLQRGWRGGPNVRRTFNVVFSADVPDSVMISAALAAARI